MKIFFRKKFFWPEFFCSRWSFPLPCRRSKNRILRAKNDYATPKGTARRWRQQKRQCQSLAAAEEAISPTITVFWRLNLCLDALILRSNLCRSRFGWSLFVWTNYIFDQICPILPIWSIFRPSKSPVAAINYLPSFLPLWACWAGCSWAIWRVKLLWWWMCGVANPEIQPVLWCFGRIFFVKMKSWFWKSSFFADAFSWGPSRYFFPQMLLAAQDPPRIVYSTQRTGKGAVAVAWSFKWVVVAADFRNRKKKSAL